MQGSIPNICAKFKIVSWCPNRVSHDPEQSFCGSAVQKVQATSTPKVS